MSDPGQSPSADNPSTPGGTVGGFHVGGGLGGFQSPEDAARAGGDELGAQMLAAGMNPTNPIDRAIAGFGRAVGAPPDTSRMKQSSFMSMGSPGFGAALTLLGEAFNKLEKLGAGRQMVAGTEGPTAGVGGGGPLFNPKTGELLESKEAVGTAASAAMPSLAAQAARSEEQEARRSASSRMRSGRVSTLLSDTRGERLGA